MRTKLTQAEREIRADRIRGVLQAIPADHPFARVVVEIVDDLANETLDTMIAPPSAVSAEDRVYNAGRVSFAEDLLQRLEAWHRSAEQARAAERQASGQPGA